MRHAFSVITIKDYDEDNRTFSGIATTPTPDLVDDIVEPLGAEFNLPIPLLWQHDAAKPIGHVTKATVTRSGITVEGRVEKISEPGKLKDRLDEAWQSLKSKLVRGLSIGFRGLETADIKGTYGYRYIRWKWLELSVVTIPANTDATILSIKAALGYKTKSPGASGQTPMRKNMKTIFEQLDDLVEARRTKSARMAEIAEAVSADSRNFSDDEAAEFDGLESEMKALDTDIRFKRIECQKASTAKPVVTPKAPTIIKRTEKDEDFKGQNYVRMVIAKALAYTDQVSPVAIAQKRWGQKSPMLIEVLKAAVTGGDSTTTGWAAELVTADNRYTGDFIEFLKSRTVFDRLPLRQIPANVTIKGQSSIGTGYWVGESKAIPVSAMGFNDVTLSPLKVAALAVVSNELLRDSSPSAEMLVRDALEEASRQRVDGTFLGTAAASAGVSPAGMLNGVTAITSAGTDAVALRADVAALYAPFITALNASGLYYVMGPSLAKQIQLLTNALGLVEFPGITQDGGTLLADPVVTGDNVGAGDLILLKPSDIFKIGDAGVEVSISREATIEMDSAPAMDSQTPTTATGALVNMFQTESTAIKVVRPINFAKRRSGAVQFIDVASYSGIETVTP